MYIYRYFNFFILREKFKFIIENLEMYLKFKEENEKNFNIVRNLIYFFLVFLRICVYFSIIKLYYIYSFVYSV